MKTDTIFKLICTALIVIMMLLYFRRNNKVSSFLYGAVSGLISLMLLDEIGEYINVSVVMNYFNIGGSILFGVPYVILLTIMNFL